MKWKTLFYPICLFILIHFELNLKGESNKTDFVTITITINTDYRNIDSVEYQLKKIMKYVPWRRIKVTTGDTISGITTHYFRFGLTESKEAYSLVEKEILSENKLNEPESLKPGYILIPTLPQIATRQWNLYKTFNRIPKIYDYSNTEILNVKTSQSIPNYVLTSDPIVEASGRKGARKSVLKLKFKMETLMEIIEDKKFWEKKNIQVEKHRIYINFGNDNLPTINTPKFHSVLTQSEIEKIRDILITKQKRRVNLVILDSGWPDPVAYKESAKEIFNLFDNARDYLRLPAKKRKENCCYKQPKNNHCILISKALREFQKLDPEKKIKIIYFPLTRGENATPILEELLFIHLISRKLHPNVGLDPPTNSMERHSKREMTEIIKEIPFSKEGAKIESDKIILDALFSLLEISQKKEKVPFFLNLSWTVVNRLLKPQYPDFPMGIVIAAAGNIKDKNIYDEPYIDLASRSKNYLDTIAIINVARGKKNIWCESSKVILNSTNYHHVNALAFDGKISEKICGTSFSAPRVAWLLALSEAYQEKEVEKSDWLNNLNNKLFKIRKKIVNPDTHDYNDFSHIWIDPIKLLKNIKNLEDKNDQKF